MSRKWIYVSPETFTCLCSRTYDRRDAAEQCLEKHKEVFLAQRPRYEVGATVVTHKGNDSRCYTEETTIVRIDEDLFDTKILVETKRGERHLVSVCNYQTVEFRDDHPRLRFVPLAKASQ